MPLNDKKLIQLRVSKGLSQNEVAKCLNISQATISYIESGKHSDVKIKQVEALAEFYGVTVHYLLDYIEPRESGYKDLYEVNLHIEPVWR